MRHGFHFRERGRFCFGPHRGFLEQVSRARTRLQELTLALQSETVRSGFRLGWML
jgi:hypothetical protein